MRKVKLLDRHTAELIAAGEVVERPASVVKELVENSIDAGAQNIRIEIENGGVSLIRITDDGDGISPDDVPVAFLRHATSKISTGEDLESIMSLGFRGEALASIAAVSRVEMVTCTGGDNNGCRYVIEGGEELLCEEWGCAKGTVILIRDMFYNTPARMKFLKKDASEAGAVAAIVDRLALSHPEISFCFVRDGKQTLQTFGDGDLKGAIYAVFGREFSESLMPVNYTYNGIKVTGFISKPVMARANRSFQVFFINSRYCRSIAMQKALEVGYKGAIMVGKFPACVLNLEIPFGAVDVNVHPAKMEVRFTNERPVFEGVYYAVKAAVAQDDNRREIEIKPAVTVDFQPVSKQVKLEAGPRAEWEEVPEHSFYGEGITRINCDNQVVQNNTDKFIENPTKFELEIVNVADAGIVFPSKFSPSISSSNFKMNPDIFVDEIEKKVDIKDEQILREDDPFKLKDYNIIGEIFGTYILIESGEKFILIDKHAAHERLIYNRLKLEEAAPAPQMLLESIIVSLGNSEYQNAVENLAAFAQAGFETEDFGDGRLVIRAVPTMLIGGDIEGAVTEIAEKIPYFIDKPTSERVDEIYHTIACRAAIKARDRTTIEEMAALAFALEEHPEVRYCPHGRPVSVVLTKREIEKNFGRVK